MISPDPQSVEIQILAAVDGAFAEARRRAGDWITCHAGCDDCCRRPFAITAQDAQRLQTGLQTLAPELQADIRQRAAEARRQITDDFPGDLARGELTSNDEWREWFFTRHAGLPCPVLDLETGECRLYAHRPVACRLAGPLIQIGQTRTDPCPLCFPEATEVQIQSTEVVIHQVEFKEVAGQAETLILLVL